MLSYPNQAWSELEEQGVLSAEALINVRPFLHHMGKDPSEVIRSGQSSSRARKKTRCTVQIFF